MAEDRASASDQEAVARVLELTRKFGDLTAVNQISLTINRDEIFGMIGPNWGGQEHAH